MNYRTDLAIESVEMYRSQFGAASQLGASQESAPPSLSKRWWT